MPKGKKLHVKIGDNVKIISGFDKNKTGEITKIYRNTGKILVKGINFKFKHIKPNTENEIGESGTGRRNEWSCIFQRSLVWLR